MDDISMSDSVDSHLFGKRGNIKYNPLRPVYVFKHGYFQRDNKGKWGLNESTELREFLKPKTPMSFEPKYLYVILACILVNLWRVEQAITIAKPFILQYRSNNDGQNPSIFQLRRALNELPFQDFVRQFTFHCLQELQQLARQTIILSFFSPALRQRI